MEGIITVKDTRENLNAMQQFRQSEAIKIAKSLSTEGVIDTIADGVKTVVTTAGLVLNVVTKFFPGKLDDIAVAVAQPAIVSVIDAGRNLIKGILVNKDQQQIVASITDLSCNAKEITIKDSNLVETLKNKAAEKVINRMNKNNIKVGGMEK
jgi:hypothetical protein